MVGFPIALKQRLDGLVLHADLPSEKFILAFEALHVLGRYMSRLVGACRRFLSRLVVPFLPGDSCRDRSRLVATGRGRSHLLQIGDVLVYRRRRNEIFLSEGSFDQTALQVALGAIALDATWRAGKSGTRVAFQRLIDIEGEIAVGTCRDRSRLVVGHGPNDNPPRSTPRRLSPCHDERGEQSRCEKESGRMGGSGGLASPRRPSASAETG